MAAIHSSDQPGIHEAIRVHTEYETLKTVLLHRPGLEVDRLTPTNKADLLFEDIPDLPRMQDEHDAFAELLGREGVRVLYLEKLLEEVLSDSLVRQELIEEVCNSANQPQLGVWLETLDVSALAQVLFSGITHHELEELGAHGLGVEGMASHEFVLRPIPNAYFMRDPAAAIGKGLVSCKMHHNARIRETQILRTVFAHHPHLRDVPILYGDHGKEERPYTIEGGDIIALKPRVICVGCSERTRSESIRTLAQRLFQRELVDRVYEIPIPATRQYIHLDTVFTVVAPGVVVAYPDVMNYVSNIVCYKPRVLPEGDVIAIPVNDLRRFNRILDTEFQCSTEVVHTGGDSPIHAAREQWADGTNVLAIRPGEVITYERNRRTNAALRARGISVHEIPGSELVRGLGGPRCMSMPLVRGEAGGVHERA